MLFFFLIDSLFLCQKEKKKKVTVIVFSYIHGNSTNTDVLLLTSCELETIMLIQLSISLNNGDKIYIIKQAFNHTNLWYIMLYVK